MIQKSVCVSVSVYIRSSFMFFFSRFCFDFSFLLANEVVNDVASTHNIYKYYKKVMLLPIVNNILKDSHAFPATAKTTRKKQITAMKKEEKKSSQIKKDTSKRKREKEQNQCLICV